MAAARQREATTAMMTVDRLILGPPRLDYEERRYREEFDAGHTSCHQRRCRGTTTPPMKHVDVLPQLVLDGAGRCHIYFSLASSMPFLEFLQLAPRERASCGRRLAPSGRLRALGRQGPGSRHAPERGHHGEDPKRHRTDAEEIAHDVQRMAPSALTRKPMRSHTCGATRPRTNVAPS